MVQNAQPRTDPVDKRAARSVSLDISPRLERKWFEFDRSVVLRQIDTIQNAIDQNAKELGMVAVEGVFEKSLSYELSRTSRSLLATVQKLSSLRALVARAKGYPKANNKQS